MVHFVGMKWTLTCWQLGDGRAISLGEAVGMNQNQTWELQLKGAGAALYACVYLHL